MLGPPHAMCIAKVQWNRFCRTRHCCCNLQAQSFHHHTCLPNLPVIVDCAQWVKSRFSKRTAKLRCTATQPPWSRHCPDTSTLCTDILAMPSGTRLSTARNMQARNIRNSGRAISRPLHCMASSTHLTMPHTQSVPVGCTGHLPCESHHPSCTPAVNVITNGIKGTI